MKNVVGLSLFFILFFHLNYPLHNNVWFNVFKPETVFKLMFFFLIYHSSVKLAAIVSDH